MVDLTNLHPGIDHYYRGHVRPDSSMARSARMKPLNLMHYTGQYQLKCQEILYIKDQKFKIKGRVKTHTLLDLVEQEQDTTKLFELFKM